MLQVVGAGAAFGVFDETTAECVGTVSDKAPYAGRESYPTRFDSKYVGIFNTHMECVASHQPRGTAGHAEAR